MMKHLFVAIQQQTENSRHAQSSSSTVSISTPAFIDKFEISTIMKTPALCHSSSRFLHDVDVHRGEQVLQGLYDRGQPVVFRGEIPFHHAFCDLCLKKDKFEILDPSESVQYQI